MADTSSEPERAEQAGKTEVGELPRPGENRKLQIAHPVAPSVGSAGGGDPEGKPAVGWAQPSNLLTYLRTDIDPIQASFPLTAFCFMTGFVDAITFTSVFVWCGFQTGNSVQLALAIARLFDGPPGHRDTSFHIADKQALTSLLTFIAGAFIGRVGDRIGPRTRLWLILGTFLQALFTMSAALAVWKSGDPSIASERGDPAWTGARTFVAIGFISASLGLQGIMGKRVNSQFATTVVLTTIWCELMADPQLFQWRRWVTTRDQRIVAVLIVFVGGFVGRAILDAIGAAGTLGVGTGIRLLITVAWFFVPAKTSEKK